MQGHVNLAIKEARVLNITCPGRVGDLKTGHLCTAPFLIKDIKEIVDAKTWEQYERFIKLKTDDSYVECPKCNQLQKGNRFKPAMVCEREACKTQFCFLHSGAHPGKTCRDYEVELHEKTKASRKYISERTILCPNPCCGAPIEKNGGCNHMTCQHCKANFCWQCGGYYMGGLHYAPFNFMGCPDMQFFGEHSPPNTRSTCCRDFCKALSWPFVFLALLGPMLCLMTLFLVFESLWLVAFVVTLPCMLCWLCNICLREEGGGSSCRDAVRWSCVGCTSFKLIPMFFGWGMWPCLQKFACCHPDYEWWNHL